MNLNPYLFYDGNCEEAFRFYEKVLHGQIAVIMKHRGSPAESQVPAEWQDKVMHARLNIGEQFIMASDAPPGRQQKMSGFSVSLNVTQVDEAERIFKELSAGGTVVMPIGQTFWARRFAMFNDRFGVPWMINCE